MMEILGGFIIGGIIVLFLTPYFCLWHLQNDFENELTEIKKELKKLNERIYRQL
jgi:hypothetical protein